MWNAKAAEAIEAYKKELEEYKNSIAAATDDNQQLSNSRRNWWRRKKSTPPTTPLQELRMPNLRKISLSVSRTVEYV